MLNNKHRKLFIFSGEQSGDLHGSNLIKALKERDSSLSFEGVCGPHMRELNVPSILNMEEFEVMGLTDVLLALPRIYKNFYKIRDHILHTQPEAVILIDYPGFNLRLAKALRKKGFKQKIIQYVSPSVWAWGKHRIQEMEQTLDLLMVIYPFEKAYFENTRLKTAYIGNPIQEYIRNYAYDNEWKTKLNLQSFNDSIAIFPGSRISEIKRNLPILLETAQSLFKQDPTLHFAISYANDSAKNFIELLLASSTLTFQSNVSLIPKQYTYELMRDSRTAIAKSGTVMLELALHKRPSIAVYQLNMLNRLYAKHYLKLTLPFYCIVNILTNQSIFPEFIEKDLTVESLSRELQDLHQDGNKRTESIKGCEQLINVLGKHKVGSAAADSVLETLSC